MTNDKWGWLPHDENGNPIFDDFGIIFELWLIDQIVKEPVRDYSSGAASEPMQLRDWLAWGGVLVVGVIVAGIWLYGS